MRENNRGCKVNLTFVGEWGTRPGEFCSKAKAKALSCLDQENPKLTVLERAYWEQLRNGCQQKNVACRVKVRSGEEAKEKAGVKAPAA